MTRLTYYEKDNEISIELQGHAGYDKIGSDIVCAAISTLSQTLLAYLNVDHDEFNYSLREGYLWCYAKGKNAIVAFHTIMAGFHLVEDRYPDCLVIQRGCSIQRES